MLKPGQVMGHEVGAGTYDVEGALVERGSAGLVEVPPAMRLWVVCHCSVTGLGSAGILAELAGLCDQTDQVSEVQQD